MGMTGAGRACVLIGLVVAFVGLPAAAFVESGDEHVDIRS